MLDKLLRLIEEYKHNIEEIKWKKIFYLFDILCLENTYSLNIIADLYTSLCQLYFLHSEHVCNSILERKNIYDEVFISYKDFENFLVRYSTVNLEKFIQTKEKLPRKKYEFKNIPCEDLKVSQIEILDNKNNLSNFLKDTNIYNNDLIFDVPYDESINNWIESILVFFEKENIERVLLYNLFENLPLKNVEIFLSILSDNFKLTSESKSQFYDNNIIVELYKK